MRRTINTDKIDEVSIYMTDKLNLIQETKKELLNDIQKISNYYKSTAADSIINKCTEEVNKLDIFINTIDSYTKYFNWLTKNYGENLNNTKNKFAMISNDIKFNKNDNELPYILNIKELFDENRED